jgi:Ca-activated chloride channel family protein
MEIHFAYPFYLWLLIAVPLIIFSHFMLLRYNQYKALKFANFIALQRVTGKKILTRNITVLILRAFILLFLILALAQPSVRYTSRIANYDYVLAIDTSASMTATDFSPSRLAVAKTAADEFIRTLPLGSDIGLVTFSGTTFVAAPLEDNRIALQSELAKIQIMKAGGTDIPGAIIASTNLLLNTEQGRAIILITDGSNTVNTFLEDSMQQAITYANRKNVRIFTIGIGSESGPIGYLPSYYNISATYNEDALVMIANETQGKYFSAQTTPHLKEAFLGILDQSKQGQTEFKLAFGLVSVALFLLFIEWGLINTRFRRYP